MAMMNYSHSLSKCY